MLAASATIALGASRSAFATDLATAPIGVQTITRSASATASSGVAPGVSVLRAAARAATPASTSQPRTVHPARAAAMAIDVPIRPVPTIATRSTGRTDGGSGFEVIAQCFRSVEVHVHDLPQSALRFEVYRDPHHR